MPKKVDEPQFVPCFVDPTLDCPERCGYRASTLQNMVKIARRRRISVSDVALGIRAVAQDDERRRESILLAFLSGKIRQCARRDEFPVVSVEAK